MLQQGHEALIIEDDRMQWICYERPMKEEGWHCTFVLGGEDAVEQLSKKKYDLIIFDLGIQEPGYGSSLSRGVTVFSQIRERTDTPILMVTIHKDRFPGEKFIKQLVPDYCIPKPFTPNELRHAIAELACAKHAVQ